MLFCFSEISEKEINNSYIELLANLSNLSFMLYKNNTKRKQATLQQLSETPPAQIIGLDSFSVDQTGLKLKGKDANAYSIVQSGLGMVKVDIYWYKYTNVCILINCFIFHQFNSLSFMIKTCFCHVRNRKIVCTCVLYMYINFSCFNNDIIECLCLFNIIKWRQMSKITRITFILYIPREREREMREGFMWKRHTYMPKVCQFIKIISNLFQCKTRLF